MLIFSAGFTSSAERELSEMLIKIRLNAERIKQCSYVDTGLK